MHDEDDGPRHLTLAFAAAAATIVGLTLARNVALGYGTIVFAAPVLLVVRAVLIRRDAAALSLQRLRASWGEPVERARDLSALRRLFVACEGPTQSPAALDDATWDDLDLDTVFAQLDRTLSAPGEYLLYEILRTPSLLPDVLAARESRLAALEATPETRATLREILGRLARTPIDPLADLLFGARQTPHENRSLLTAQAALPFVGIAIAILFDGTLGLLTCGVAVVSNAMTHFRIKNEIAGSADGFRYLSSLVRIGGTLGEVARNDVGAGLDPLLDEIADVARAAKAIGAKGARIGLSERAGGADVLQAVYEYVSIFMLLEVRNYYAIVEQLDATLPDLRRLFRLIGELDALQSVASWRTGLPGFCRPEFVDGERTLRVEDAVHPLLDDPIPNSFDLTAHSLVVTGSNMSGKSTFLRTIGLATIFAQTLHTVPAVRYVACPLRVASSVTIRDDIESGRSFYLAEAQRLLRLLRFADEDGPALVLVDEPLRGTNSTERIAAVSEILLHLAEVGALTVVATHELQIAELVATRYFACHLGDEVDDAGLRFLHRVVPGIATSRNAIRLLGQIGYPDALVAAADRRAAEIDRDEHKATE